MTQGEGGFTPQHPQRPSTPQNPGQHGRQEPAPYDSGIQVRIGPRGSGSHRSRREQGRAPRRRTRTNGLVIAATAAVATVGAAAGLYFLRDSVGSQPNPASASAASQSAAASGVGPTSVTAAGPQVKVTTAQGDAYAMAAVNGGGITRGGQTFAYADYVLTNTLNRPVLLNLPADLFVRRDLVADNLKPRCMPQSGTPADMCTLPDTSKVIGYLNGSPAPLHQDSDDYMPPHSAYLVRITTSLPVSASVGRADLGVFVWNALYVPDQQARPIAFP